MSAAHVLTGIIGAIIDICACLPNGRVLEGEGVSWQRHAHGCAFCEALDWKTGTGRKARASLIVLAFVFPLPGLDLFVLDHDLHTYDLCILSSKTRNVCKEVELGCRARRVLTW